MRGRRRNLERRPLLLDDDDNDDHDDEYIFIFIHCLSLFSYSTEEVGSYELSSSFTCLIMHFISGISRHDSTAALPV